MSQNLEKVCQASRFLLKESPEAESARSYLESRVNGEAEEKFHFGYFPSSNTFNLLSDIVGLDLLKEEQLAHTRQSSTSNQKIFSYFEDHPLVMPYRDAYGNVVAMVGRSLLSDEERKEKRLSKYKNTVFNKGNHLFGLFEAKEAILQSGFAYIVEGQFDVIKAHERGLKNIVALGNSNMSPYQVALLSRYTDTFFVVLDNDDAGEKGRKKIEEKYGDKVSVINLFLPDGYKDIDEYLKQNDVDSLTFLC